MVAHGESKGPAVIGDQHFLQKVLPPPVSLIFEAQKNTKMVLDFLTQHGSPFHHLPHTLACFVFFLIICHVTGLLFTLMISFFLSFSPFEDLRITSFVVLFPFFSFTAFLIWLIIFVRNFIMGGNNDTFSQFIKSQVSEFVNIVIRFRCLCRFI
jgi:hypothetical protein